MSTTDDLTGALLAAAHTYRNRGWRVIQLHSVGPDGQTCSCNKGALCTSKGKHPRDNAWQNTEAYSAADIEALWAERPKANVGLATGEASGFWVLDIDPDSGGLETMNALVGEHGSPECGYIVRTGSGGWHYYFAMEPGLRNSQNRIGKGVDVRADGGQVVAPPSRTDKGAYVVAVDQPVAKAPEWLLALARKPEHDGPVVTTETLPKPEEISEDEWDRLNGYMTRAVSAELARLDECRTKGWDGPPWDLTTFEVACALVEFANSPWNAYSTSDAYAALFGRAPRDENFNDDTVNTKWRSAVDKVGNKARAMPAGRPQDAGDDLFNGPDVRGRQDPTEGGGAPTTPAAGNGSGIARFFTGDKGSELDATELSEAILEMGPVGFGKDMDFWSYEGGVWRSDREVVRRRCTQLLGYKYRPAHTATAKDVVRFMAEEIDGEPRHQWMNFTNGMLDWQTGKLVEHHPSYRSTIQFPIAYEPEATCPTFDAFLADILHPDYVRLCWEILGYLMYSGNPLQTAVLFYGSGQNGKGTLIRVIEEILGKGNIANESLDQLNKSTFSSVNLYGKIANIAGDIDATYQESTANFKKITGEDMIGAERKFGDRFQFESWAVPLFSANTIPGSSDVTEGYLRRWVVLHFRKTISKQDRKLGLSRLLSGEREGIAAKAILALRRLMEREQFDLSGEAGKGHEEFAETIDQVRQWVKHGGPKIAPDHQQPLSEIYFEYTVWANKTGQGQLREPVFSKRLASIGFPAEDVAGVTYHQGIRVTPGDRSNTTANFF